MSKQDAPSSPKSSVEELTAYERWELPTLTDGADPRSVPGMRSAVKVKPLTAEDLEQIRQEAYRDGFKQGQTEGLKVGMQEGREQGLVKGREEGLDKGREQAQLELQANKNALGELAQNLLTPIDNQREDIEQVLLNTTLALVRSVIHCEVSQNPEIIKLALNTALSSLPKHASQVKIQLNPDDARILNDILSTLAPEAKVVANSALSRGGCIVETSDQILNQTIEKRYQRAVQAMLLSAAQKQNFEAHQETPQTLQSHTEYEKALLDEGAGASEHAAPDEAGHSAASQASEDSSQSSNEGVADPEHESEQDRSDEVPKDQPGESDG